MLNKYQKLEDGIKKRRYRQKVQEKNITKTKTKRIISESSRKNITKTKTKRIISESLRNKKI